MLRLKEKFKYKIRRSSKNRFDVSCKHIDCKFLLCAIGMQGAYWTVGKFVKDHSCQLNLLNNYHRQIPTKVITSLINPKLQENGCINK